MLVWPLATALWSGVAPQRQTTIRSETDIICVWVKTSCPQNQKRWQFSLLTVPFVWLE